MPHALLWVETLITALLWLAAALGYAAGITRKWVYRMLTTAIAILPFGAAFAGLAAISAILKFEAKIRANWFSYATSLFLCYLLLAVVIFVRGSRTGGMSMPRGASAWPRQRLALGMLTAFAITAMTIWNMDIEARIEGGHLRNEAGAMMLSVLPPNVGDSHNAAVVYEKAFARLKADKLLADSPLYSDEPDITGAATADLLKRHQLTIKQLRRATAMPDCRFDHDDVHPSFSMLLPELNWSRTAAKLLALDARWAIAHGDVESAAADVSAIAQLSKAAGTEPFAVGFLVSASIDAMAEKSLEEVLAAATRPEQLANLDFGESAFDSRILVRCLRGEEALGLAMFGDVASGRMSFSNLMDLMTPSSPISGNGSVWQEFSKCLSSVAAMPAPTLARIFLLSGDVAAYRELMEGYQASATLPYYKADRGNMPNGSSIRQGGLLTGLIAPALQKIFETAVRARASHAAACVAVAMTRYRLDHGNVPATLDLLVPNYLDDVPLDPFDGKPLRLIEKPDRAIVYSIGPDLVDDGGTPLDSKTRKGDITFVLKVAPAK